MKKLTFAEAEKVLAAMGDRSTSTIAGERAAGQSGMSTGRCEMRAAVLVLSLAVALAMAGCAAPSPAPRVAAAKKDYADCLGREIPKAAKSDALAGAAADSAISICSGYRTALYAALRTTDGDTPETATVMADYDQRVHGDAVDYVNDLRR